MNQQQYIDLKLIDDPIKEGNKIKKVYNASVKNPFEAYGRYYSVDLLEKFISGKTLGKLGSETENLVDILISNVPGPKKEIYIAGSKVTDFFLIPTPNTKPFFLAILTYGGRFQLSLGLDSALKISAKKFITLMEVEIENIINKYQ